jgi:hypothetical protein
MVIANVGSPRRVIDTENEEWMSVSGRRHEAITKPEPLLALPPRHIKGSELAMIGSPTTRLLPRGNVMHQFLSLNLKCKKPSIQICFSCASQMNQRISRSRALHLSVRQHSGSYLRVRNYPDSVCTGGYELRVYPSSDAQLIRIRHSDA